MVFAEIDAHKMHVYAAGNENGPGLVFMSGSGTVSPEYDFKILYEKLSDDHRIIVVEKFGYGYSDLYEGPCGIDSAVDFQREALAKAGEKGPYILLPHSMAGLEAIRWKQKYPQEVSAVIGLDMAVPAVYLNWDRKQIEQRIRYMRKLRWLNSHGLLFWYPLSMRGLDRDEIRQHKKLLRRNAMNPCIENEAKAVMENAGTVDAAGGIDSPVLMFISDGKQVSSGWIDHAVDFAGRVNAKTVFLDCGHYVHYYESERISREIRAFLQQIHRETTEYGDPGK